LGYGTAATGDGRYLLVAVPAANRVAVVDLRSIEVPRAPQEVLIAPDNRAAYVSCDASHQVAEIGLADWKVKLIDAGRGADGLAWAGGK
jgi:DNA-binding beta-propeller fold protein YncE